MSTNPAIEAAEEAFDKIKRLLEQKQNFVLEAGAGAGKTYTLVQSLKYLLETRGQEFQQKGQKVACITFTNVARDEIISRIDNNPCVFPETIHAFCWSLIRSFQPEIRQVLNDVGSWHKRLDDKTEIKTQVVKYDLGYPSLKEKVISLAHDDVLEITARFMKNNKFKKILVSRYPVLLIDEYQDTNKIFADALIEYFLDQDANLQLGFFGDHWQKIYGKGCGQIQHSNLIQIGKGSNFRSKENIVTSLNKIRPELQQKVHDDSSVGQITIFHTNEWSGSRRTSSHWKGDLPANEAHRILKKVISNLEDDGWFFDEDETKILMLTHNILAEEQGYRSIAKVFKRKDSFIKKEDETIEFLVDIVEPICEAYEKKEYGKIFSILGAKAHIVQHEDKIAWANELSSISKMRTTSTIGEVIDFIEKSDYLALSDKVLIRNRRLKTDGSENEENDGNLDIATFAELREKNYMEIIALRNFIEEKTPFYTKHGVKGEEFENVLVVFGRGWNQYNFGQMLEWCEDGVPPGKQKTFIRNRNLFYVVCSRAKTNLSLFFTQKLSDKALLTLKKWFGQSRIISIK